MLLIFNILASSVAASNHFYADPDPAVRLMGYGMRTRPIRDWILIRTPRIDRIQIRPSKEFQPICSSNQINKLHVLSAPFKKNSFLRNFGEDAFLNKSDLPGSDADSKPAVKIQDLNPAKRSDRIRTYNTGIQNYVQELYFPVM